MVITFTPSGREGAMSRSSLSLTLSMTSSTFWPKRTITMPPATSPVPSRSATPRLISGPTVTSATLFTRMGVPFPSEPREMSPMSSAPLM